MLRSQVVDVLNVGRFEVEREHSFGSMGHVARSHFLVCPECKLIWAELRFPDDPFGFPVAGFCETHSHTSNWLPVPGSILSEEGYGVIDDSLLAILPDVLVRREFDLHLKAYSK